MKNKYIRVSQSEAREEGQALADWFNSRKSNTPLFGLTMRLDYLTIDGFAIRKVHIKEPVRALKQYFPKDAKRLFKAECRWGRAFPLLAAALVLVEHGLWNRIRRCKRCRRYFYARRKDARFCTPRCQQAGYKNTDAWRSEHAEYMRRYRQDEKDRNARAHTYAKRLRS